eukprot:scaffold986_cov237-Pinguiococcus_pyrenoidosus.AAC.6
MSEKIPVVQGTPAFDALGGRLEEFSSLYVEQKFSWLEGVSQGYVRASSAFGPAQRGCEAAVRSCAAWKCRERRKHGASAERGAELVS